MEGLSFLPQTGSNLISSHELLLFTAYSDISKYEAVLPITS